MVVGAISGPLIGQLLVNTGSDWLTGILGVVQYLWPVQSVSLWALPGWDGLGSLRNNDFRNNLKIHYRGGVLFCCFF